MENSKQIKNSIERKRYTIMIPMMAVMYFLALLARNNIGYAFDGMSESFALSATISGLVGGVFFLGYFILQIPGGNLAQKVSAKKIITFCLIAWSVVSIAMGFITNSTQLVVMRFLLGLSQSMLYPTTLVLIGKWFPMNERARAIGLWSIGATAASFVVGPLSGIIVDNLGWNYLFIVMAIPAIIFVFIWNFVVAETPEESRFLSDDEKAYLKAEFEKDKILTKEKENDGSSWKTALSNKYVWILATVFFLNNMFNYGLSIWWPTISSSMTGSSLTVVGFLSTIAPLLALAVMFIVSNHSDKTGERKKHAAGVLIVSGLALLVSALTGANPLIAVLFILIAQGIWGGFSPVFWSIPPIIIDAAIIGAATGFINGFGNLGGFVGPYFFGYLIDLTGSTQVGLIFIVAVQVFAGLLLLSIMSPRLKEAQEKISADNSSK